MNAHFAFGTMARALTETREEKATGQRATEEAGKRCPESWVGWSQRPFAGL
jgi:hypothetical protein